MYVCMYMSTFIKVTICHIIICLPGCMNIYVFICTPKTLSYVCREGRVAVTLFIRHRRKVLLRISGVVK